MLGNSFDDQLIRSSDLSVDIGRLGHFLEQAIGVAGPMSVRQFQAGHSNLTYLVSINAQELVVKRAPPGTTARGAHDMGREYRMLAALQGHYVYAPRPLAYCEDRSILGSPFLVMERSKGIIVHSNYPPEVSAATIRAQFEHLVDGLGDLHALDINKCRLVSFGRPTGYRQRQVSGWSKRLENASTPGMPAFQEIATWLEGNLPDEREPSVVVHNDFKLDNLVWHADDVAALKTVLDWEMSTVGDPSFDLACTLSFWIEEGDPPTFKALRGMPSARPGMMTRREAVERYCSRAGRPVMPLQYLLCFGLFRRAVLEQQKYIRFVRGDTQDSRFASADKSVKTLHEMCWRAIRGEIPG